MDARVRRMGDQVVISAKQARDFLHTPAGRRFRRYLAGGIILTAPLLFRIPGLRRYPLVRALEVVGGAALIVKMAEALRDWERSGERSQQIVIDVPPAPER